MYVYVCFGHARVSRHAFRSFSGSARFTSASSCVCARRSSVALLARRAVLKHSRQGRTDDHLVLKPFVPRTGGSSNKRSKRPHAHTGRTFSNTCSRQSSSTGVPLDCLSNCLHNHPNACALTLKSDSDAIRSSSSFVADEAYAADGDDWMICRSMCCC